MALNGLLQNHACFWGVYHGLSFDSPANSSFTGTSNVQHRTSNIEQNSRREKTPISLSHGSSYAKTSAKHAIPRNTLPKTGASPPPGERRMTPLIQKVGGHTGDLGDKVIDGFAGFEVGAGTAIDDTLCVGAFADFAHRAMADLYAIPLAPRAINHFGREVEIMRHRPLGGGLLPQRLVIVLHREIRPARRTIQPTIRNHLFHFYLL